MQNMQNIQNMHNLQNRQRQAKKGKSSKKRTNQAKTQRFTHHHANNQTVCIPSCREPNGLRTIAPRTKQFGVPNHYFCDMLYMDLTLSMGTKRAMLEARSTWTKRVGAEPKTKTKT